VSQRPLSLVDTPVHFDRASAITRESSTGSDVMFNTPSGRQVGRSVTHWQTNELWLARALALRAADPAAMT
jgi:hypothetical protein